MEENSNAERNGIIAGDKLLSYDGRFLDSIDQLLELIESTKTAGREQIEVVIYRNGNRLMLNLAPGRMGVHIAEEITSQ